MQKLLYSTSEALRPNPLVEAYYDAALNDVDGVITVFCDRRPVLLIELDGDAGEGSFTATVTRGVEYTDRQSRALVRLLEDLSVVTSYEAHEYEESLDNERTAKHLLARMLTKVDGNEHYAAFVNDLVEMAQPR
ncbi:MAG TPA: hypothetical protein VFL58_14790 [Gaiellaceae bacterium]|nr:hypothetical protein [Gaiellaceae bacterium]